MGELSVAKSERSPGLRLPSEDRNLNLSWLASDPCLIYTWYIPVTYLSYSKTCFLGTIELLHNNTLWTCISSSSNIHRFFESLKILKIYQIGICMLYIMYIPGICPEYTIKSRCVVLQENDAFWKFSGFCIRMYSSMAWDYSIDWNRWKYIFSRMVYGSIHQSMFITGIYMVYTK